MSNKSLPEYLSHRLSYLIYNLRCITQDRLKLIVIGFILGIIVLKITSVIAIILLLTFYSKKKGVIITSVIFGLCYALLWMNRINYDAGVLLQNNSSEVNARITEAPKRNLYGSEVVLEIDGFCTLAIAKLPLYPKYAYGDELIIKGKFESLNTTNQTYLNYLNSKKVFLEFRIDSVYLREDSIDITKLANYTSRNIVSLVNSNLKEPAASLTNGILLGANTNFSDELNDSLIRTGTSHIVSASGSNIMILFLIGLFITGFLNSKISKIIGLILGIFYLLIIGTYILPAQRATIMIVFIYIGLLLGRKGTFLNALLISIVLILIQYPFYFENISFILSVFATIGLFLFAPVLTKRIRTQNKFIKVMIEATLITIAATFATLPVTLMTFGSVSLISVVANMLVLPFVPLLTMTTILGVVISVFNIEVITRICFIATELITTLILKIIGFLSNLSFAFTEDTRVGILILFTIGAVLLLFDFKNFNDER